MLSKGEYSCRIALILERLETLVTQAAPLSVHGLPLPWRNEFDLYELMTVLTNPLSFDDIEKLPRKRIEMIFTSHLTKTATHKAPLSLTCAALTVDVQI